MVIACKKKQIFELQTAHMYGERGEGKGEEEEEEKEREREAMSMFLSFQGSL